MTLLVFFEKSQRRQWHPTPVLLPGKSHGRRSLVGCSPWGREESDRTELFHFHFSLSCIGEGNGNPFQYSCLENPRDGAAWWVAIYGVTQSWIRLKRLSSSSSVKEFTIIWKAVNYFSLFQIFTFENPGCFITQTKTTYYNRLNIEVDVRTQLIFY